MLASLRTSLTRHLHQRRLYYVPLLSPVALFFLAHLGTVLALILIKSGVIQRDHLVLKTMVTWAVYGFLPLLLCSYVCFFAVARPATGLLARTFAGWSETHFNLAAGSVYGLAMGLALVVLLGPDTWFKGLMILLIAMIAGQGNWFFYRKWEPVDA